MLKSTKYSPSKIHEKEQEKDPATGLPMGLTVIDSEDFKTYFGAVGKYRFHIQTNLISQQTKIVGNHSQNDLSSIESSLASSRRINRSISEKKHKHTEEKLLNSSSSSSSSSSSFLPAIINIGGRSPERHAQTPHDRSRPLTSTVSLPVMKDGFFMTSASPSVASNPNLGGGVSGQSRKLASTATKGGAAQSAAMKQSIDDFNEDKDSDYFGEKDFYDEEEDEDFFLMNGGFAEPKPLVLSPRSKFIANCIKERVNPRAAMVVRQNFTTSLLLGHMGMGDKLAILLAESLRDLPYIQSIDISDNNLTDLGLAPLMRAMTAIPGLLVLNTSQNVIGLESATALAEYLARFNCPLQSLIVNAADVDDFECERFVTAIETSPNLIELSLANNKLGTAETLNTVYPDLTTGGEALASLLRSPICKLQTLNLSWNCIRLDSAADLASSLSVNTSLVHLDLSFNGLGNLGGETIGDAILENKTLRKLLLSSNGLKARPCFTICVGVIENLSLTFVSLDGNPIGRQGAEAIMAVPMNAGSRVSVTSRGCNFDIDDDSCTFKFSSPCRSYTLNLSECFDRAVAFALLQIGACHQTFIISNMTVDGVSIDLEQAYSNEREKYFTDEQRETVENLKRIKAAAENKDLVRELFAQADNEDRGVIPTSKFEDILRNLGIHIDATTMIEIIQMVDIDHSGEISLDELLFFLMQHHEHVSNKLRDLTEFPVMTLRGSTGGSTGGGSGGSGGNSNINNISRYIPPRKGIMKIDMIDGIAKKPICRTLSSFDKICISKIANQSGNTSSMLSHALITTKIRLAEAISLYDVMYRDSGKKIKSLASLLPQMLEASEARELISKITLGDKYELIQLRNEMGPILRPICGYTNGYYCLDMSLESSRQCLTRLLEISQTENLSLISKTQQILASAPGGATIGGGGGGNNKQSSTNSLLRKLGDTSQHSNWTCFRNELFNGEPIILSTDTFSSSGGGLPKSGKLEFDFSSCIRNEIKDKPMSDNRLLRTLQFCCLLDNIYTLSQNNNNNNNNNNLNISQLNQIISRDLLAEKAQMKAMKKRCDYVLNTQGTVVYRMTTDIAKEIGIERDKFYNNLTNRAKLYEDCPRKEAIREELHPGGDEFGPGGLGGAGGNGMGGAGGAGGASRGDSRARSRGAGGGSRAQAKKK